MSSRPTAILQKALKKEKKKHKKKGKSKHSASADEADNAARLRQGTVNISQGPIAVKVAFQKHPKCIYHL